MSNPINILAFAVTTLICFLIIYPLFQMDVFILGIALVGCILVGKALFLF